MEFTKIKRLGSVAYRRKKLRFTIIALLLLLPPNTLLAHHGHQSTTYDVTAALDDIADGPHLRLQILDAGSEIPGRVNHTAARFTLTVDGSEYLPSGLNEHGMRFVSIHRGRKQQFTATFARGSGTVLIPLPDDAKSGTVTAAKGFEYLSETVDWVMREQKATAVIRLRRWIDLQRAGWHAADEHLHYERTASKHDRDWLNMLAADGLSHAHFLVLRGGNVPGVWATQYAYGPDGEARDETRFIRSGEEYRDGTQGHINLLGVGAVIQPISTGGIGEPRIPFNYPPLLDVFRRAHQLGGIGGPAHGASLARSSTAVLDTVLGEVDFFEIANSHLYKTDVWYGLLNCGFTVPPMAGTDLPNFGFRDPWQPLLGEVRTYVKMGDGTGFDAWKAAVRRGQVFITSGPIIHFDVGGVIHGGTLRLPPGGGEVTITAELSSPRSLASLQLIQMGSALAVEPDSTQQDGIFRLKIRHKLKVNSSCWLAARGSGGPKTAIEKGLNIKQNEIAHSGIVRVLVGNQPVRSKEGVAQLRRQLESQQEYYRTSAKYAKPEDRQRFLGLFERALKELGSEAR